MKLGKLFFVMAAGVFYYIFNLVVAAFMEYLEKKLGYYRQEDHNEIFGNRAFEKDL